MTTPAEPSDTEWVVIRPAGELEFNELAPVFEGEWRRRSELPDPSVIETLSPTGIARAYPTDRVETSADGDRAQVYEVPDTDDADDSDAEDPDADDSDAEDPDADADAEDPDADSDGPAV